MLFPRLFNDVFDDDFDDFLPSRMMLNSSERNWMKTDIKEFENSYELDMDLPGFKKEDIQIELEKGYLTISANCQHNVDENQQGNYIRQERYVGSCSRSFYVGEELKHEDVQAKFESGILKLTLPKKEEQKFENKKYISIE